MSDAPELKQFGFNVIPSHNAGSTGQAEASQNTPNLFDAVTGYVQKYENVLTGEVEREINLIERQAMIVGMNLRASEVKRNFDISI